jgi:hypothetical protein
MFDKIKKEIFINNKLLPSILDVIGNKLTKKGTKRSIAQRASNTFVGSNKTAEDANMDSYNNVASHKYVIEKKLSEDEIESIFVGVGVLYMLDQNISMIKWYDGVEFIKYMKEKHRNELFGFKNKSHDVEILTKDFGYDIKNPIRVAGIPMSSIYLSSLESDEGFPIFWNRKGSIVSPDSDDICDEYEVIKNFKGEKVILYIMPYSNYTSTIAPQGFKFKNNSK